MNRKTLYTALATFALSASSAFACTAADVQARQGAFVEAVQALSAVDRAKAEEIVNRFAAELDAANASGDEAAVCETMDRLTAEAKG